MDNKEAEIMAVCKHCHTSMSKAKHARHEPTCMSMNSKGQQHFFACKSFAVDPITRKRVTRVIK